MHELEKSPYSHGLRDEAKVEFTWGSGLTHLPCVPEADLRVSGGSSASANVLGESPPPRALWTTRSLHPRQDTERHSLGKHIV